MLTLTTLIKPWPTEPNYVAYADAVDENGKKYVYDAHHCIWKDDPDDTYWGVEDQELVAKLNALIWG